MRVFAPERNEGIMDKVEKLLAANFIREVYNSDWLASVLLQATKNKTYTPKNICSSASKDRRSEERRVGKECNRRCRSRWSPDH